MKRTFFKRILQTWVMMVVISLPLIAFGASPVTTSVDRAKHPIRILAIGNSFSQDAIEQNLYELAAAEHIPLIIGNMYIGGCTLARHLHNADKNLPAYAYRKIVGGVKTEKKNVRLEEALKDEDWDYISLQQASGVSGLYDTYAASLPQLVAYVKAHATNKHVKLMLHQTWAYAKTSTHPEFPNYQCNQQTMYKAIVEAYNRAAKLVNIKILIPSGTAIQYGRASSLGDTFNRDGFHLNLTYGRYTAACTWFETILKKSVIGNPYAPQGMTEEQKTIAQKAAHEAVKKPHQPCTSL
jgi:hypothetical protein